MKKIIICASLACLLLTPSLFAEETLEECIKNSPYANKETAKAECENTSPQVETVPEKFQREDEELDARNEAVRQQNLEDLENALNPPLFIEE